MKKKFYITTSIAYTNAPPHIGFALEVLQADVLARWHRLQKDDVYFLTGTDEHGVKIVKAAENEGKNPKKFADEISKEFKELKNFLNLSNNDFIRTTDKKRHWPTVKKVWLGLKKKGDIYKKQYKGLYCAGCEAFITKKDLIDGRCLIHKKEPEEINEENYFFRLSKYAAQIKKAIKTDEVKIIPETRKNEILSFIEQGLEDISFSRPRKDLKWGIPVLGDDSQTIYVWADALSNYVSAIGYFGNNKKFKKYWPADVHCIGKDILKFHAAIWPGMLLALGLALPKSILVHGFITVGGQKMSKSLGNVVGPFELVSKYGTEAVRYYLLREIPSAEDGDFTYEKFEKRYNSDLASGIGNLTARVIAMSEKLKVQNSTLRLRSGLRLRDSGSKRLMVSGAEPSKFKTTTQNSKLKIKIEQTNDDYKKAIKEFKFNNSLALIWNLIHFCDKYIEEKKPWETDDREAVLNLLFALFNIAEMLKPFLPEASGKILKQLNAKKTGKYIKFKVRKEAPLFPRIG